MCLVGVRRIDMVKGHGEPGALVTREAGVIGELGRGSYLFDSVRVVSPSMQSRNLPFEGAVYVQNPN